MTTSLIINPICISLSREPTLGMTRKVSPIKIIWKKWRKKILKCKRRRKRRKIKRKKIRKNKKIRLGCMRITLKPIVRQFLKSHPRGIAQWQGIAQGIAQGITQGIT